VKLISDFRIDFWFELLAGAGQTAPLDRWLQPLRHPSYCIVAVR
jgi:hypothetical protein